MRTILLCLAITLALATSNVDQLNKIDSSTFGRSFIDSLEMHMQTGDPVTRFQEIIANVENMIEGEQKLSDSQFRVSQDQCDTDIAAFKIDDNLLVRRLVDIQTSLDSFGPQLAQKEDTFAQKSTFRDVLTTQLTELERQRHAELSEYQLRQKEHDFAAYVFETVKRIFTESSTSFLQIAHGEQAQKASQFLMSSIEEASHFTHKKSYASLFKVLGQVSSRITSRDQEAFVERILSLCDQLLNGVEESRAIERKAEEVRNANFELEKNLLNRDISDLNTQIDQLQAQILQLEDRITITKRDQSDASERQEQKSKQIDDRETECQQSAYNYQLARDQREANRQIVSQVIGIFSANQREFQAFVKQRAQAGNDSD